MAAPPRDTTGWTVASSVLGDAAGYAALQHAWALSWALVALSAPRSRWPVGARRPPGPRRRGAWPAPQSWWPRWPQRGGS